MSRILTFGILQQKRNYILSADVIFSILKIRATYSGACIKVRRDSDDTTMDIGFDIDGVLDTSTLLTFVGAGNGYIHTWYDQSGSRDAVQTNNALQMSIVTSGIVNTVNEIPAIKSGVGKTMTFSDILVLSIFAVTKTDLDLANAGAIMSGPGGSYVVVGNIGGPYYYWRPHGVANDFQDSPFFINGASEENRYAGCQNIVSMFRSTGAVTLNRINNASFPHKGYVQTILIYGTDQSANRLSIEQKLSQKHNIPILSNITEPSWGTPVDISVVGDTAIDTSGTLVFALDYGHTGSDLVVNGVTFVRSTGWYNSYASPGLYNRGGIGVNFETMMDAFCYLPGSPVYTLTGLIPGKSYLLQFLVSDCRATNRQQYFRLEDYPCDAFYQHQKHSVILNFVAFNEVINLMCYQSSAAVINGVQLRQLD